MIKLLNSLYLTENPRGWEMVMDAPKASTSFPPLGWQTNWFHREPPGERKISEPFPAWEVPRSGQGGHLPQSGYPAQGWMLKPQSHACRSSTFLTPPSLISRSSFATCYSKDWDHTAAKLQQIIHRWTFACPYIHRPGRSDRQLIEFPWVIPPVVELLGIISCHCPR